MDATSMDKVTDAIERVVTTTRAASTAKAMTAEEVFAYALEQVRKAARDDPSRAKRRLRALARTVEAAKQAFTDGAGDPLQIEIFEETTTAAADESEREISIGTAGAASAAYNPDDLTKALARVMTELAALRGNTATGGSEDAVKKSADLGWPSDLSSSEFRTSRLKAAAAPPWGYDPGLGEKAKRG